MKLNIIQFLRFNSLCVINGHSDDATTTVANFSDDANNNNDSNEHQSNRTLRSICLSEDVEQKFEEGHGAGREVGLFYGAITVLEESLVEEEEDMLFC